MGHAIHRGFSRRHVHRQLSEEQDFRAQASFDGDEPPDDDW